MNTDFYELLGVSRDADAQQIKKAYRNLARKYHPDTNSGDEEDEEMFKAISVAYEVLSDPEKRARYDQFGIDGLRGSGGSGQQGGSFDFNLSDLFESFFGSSGFSQGGFGGGATQETYDIQSPIEISLSEACFGTTKTILVNMDRPCDTCSGSGAKPGTAPQTCSTCGGAGAVQQVRQTFFGQMMSSAPCPTCQGMGSIISDPCLSCASRGVLDTEVELEITIPAGVETGSRLRLSGQGPSGVRGTRPGDLYVILTVTPSDDFERHGDDLVAVQEISFLHAIYGTSVDVNTLDGLQSFHVPPGTHSGEVFRLRNHGMTRLRGRGRGDLLMYVNVVIPSVKQLTDEQKELLAQYAVSVGEEIKETESHTSLFEKIKRAF